MIHLDTDVAIALLNDRQPNVRDSSRRARATGTRLCLSIIVYYELMYGAAHSKRRKSNEDKIALFIAAGGLTLLAFEEADAARRPISAPICAARRHRSARTMCWSQARPDARGRPWSPPTAASSSAYRDWSSRIGPRSRARQRALRPSPLPSPRRLHAAAVGDA